MSDPLFIDEHQIERLKQAMDIVESIKSELTYDHEEYPCIITALGSLITATTMKTIYTRNGDSF